MVTVVMIVSGTVSMMDGAMAVTAGIADGTATAAMIGAGIAINIATFIARRAIITLTVRVAGTAGSALASI